MRVAINGFGRIGKCILRYIFENNLLNVDVVAINCGSATTEMDFHLFEYDSTHGKFNGKVEIINSDLVKINNKEIKITHEKDISKLDWSGIDIVYECTGKFLSKEKAEQHIKQGAKMVLLSAPPKENSIQTIIEHINSDSVNYNDNIFSIGSCTTNCLAPVLYVLHQNFGIKNGFVTTVHSYTNDQNILDGSHKGDFRRARSAATSIIPTSTGASKAISAVMPYLTGKIDGAAVRVPVQNVSMIDLKCNLSKNISIDEVNNAFYDASKSKLSNILGFCNKPLVSVDFNRTNQSAIFDSLETKVIDSNFCRVVAWYDNEWSFAIRMIEVSNILIKSVV